MIDVKDGLHNHDLPNKFKGHAFIGRLSSYERQHVDLTMRHVPPRQRWS